MNDTQLAASKRMVKAPLRPMLVHVPDGTWFCRTCERFFWWRPSGFDAHRTACEAEAVTKQPREYEIVCL